MSTGCINARVDKTALAAILRLSHARSVGPVTYRRLVRVFGSAEAVLAAPRVRLMEVPEISARTADGIGDARRDPWADAELERAAQRGIQILTLDDPLYPRSAALDVRSAGRAVCGRNAPAGGCALDRHRRLAALFALWKAQAEKLAAGLAAAGFTVVSGLARGIDSAAHAGALSVDRGRTVAVLGNGLARSIRPKTGTLRTYRRVAVAAARA